MVNDFTKAPNYKQEIYYLYHDKLKKLEDYYTQIKNNVDDIDFSTMIFMTRYILSYQNHRQ